MNLRVHFLLANLNRSVQILSEPPSSDMETEMNRFALALVSALSLSTPVAAQSLSVLLPLLSFPDPVTTPSTKGCAEAETQVCTLQE
jgi:hypothetical protein